MKTKPLDYKTGIEVKEYICPIDDVPVMTFKNRRGYIATEIAGEIHVYNPAGDLIDTYSDRGEVLTLLVQLDCH